MRSRGKNGVLVALGAWSVALGVYLVERVLIGKRPHVQSTTTAELISLEVSVWVVGVVVIVGIALLVRRRHRSLRTKSEVTS
jgi:hypothetical protein